jgi:hypothetical protein
VLNAISLIPSPALVAQRIELRLAAGVSRAIPRRIHGVRLAITATAQSDRRIAVPEAIGVVPADQLSVVQFCSFMSLQASRLHVQHPHPEVSVVGVPLLVG